MPHAKLIKPCLLEMTYQTHSNSSSSSSSLGCQHRLSTAALSAAQCSLLSNTLMPAQSAPKRQLACSLLMLATRHSSPTVLTSCCPAAQHRRAAATGAMLSPLRQQKLPKCLLWACMQARHLRAAIHQLWNVCHHVAHTPWTLTVSMAAVVICRMHTTSRAVTWVGMHICTDRAATEVLLAVGLKLKLMSHEETLTLLAVLLCLLMSDRHPGWKRTHTTRQACCSLAPVMHSSWTDSPMITL